jgi:hypothetical protein
MSVNDSWKDVFPCGIQSDPFGRFGQILSYGRDPLIINGYVRSDFAAFCYYGTTFNKVTHDVAHLLHSVYRGIAFQATFTGRVCYKVILVPVLPSRASRLLVRDAIIEVFLR